MNHKRSLGVRIPEIICHRRPDEEGKGNTITITIIIKITELGQPNRPRFVHTRNTRVNSDHHVFSSTRTLIKVGLKDNISVRLRTPNLNTESVRHGMMNGPLRRVRNCSTTRFDQTSVIIERGLIRTISKSANVSHRRHVQRNAARHVNNRQTHGQDHPLPPG